MTERNFICLDNPNSFWGEWFWTAHANRCDRIMITWSRTQHSFVVQQWTQGRLGKSITVPDHEFEVFESAVMWAVEEKVCYARLRCHGSDQVLIGVLNCSRCKRHGETGYKLNAASLSDLADLWRWMDQMRAIRQAGELEANTAPSLGQRTWPSARL